MKKPKPNQPNAEAKSVEVNETTPVPKPERELPIVEALGLAPAGKGRWVVFALEVQGDTILKREIVALPSEKPYAAERLKVEVVKRFVYAKERV